MPVSLEEIRTAVEEALKKEQEDFIADVLKKIETGYYHKLGAQQLHDDS